MVKYILITFIFRIQTFLSFYLTFVISNLFKFLVVFCGLSFIIQLYIIFWKTLTEEFSIFITGFWKYTRDATEI